MLDPAENEELIRETEDSLSRFAEQHAHYSEATDVAAAYLDVLTATDDHTLTQAMRRLLRVLPRLLGQQVTRELVQAAIGHHGMGGTVVPRGFERADFRDHLIRVRTPALVISGAWDPIIGPRWSRA